MPFENEVLDGQWIDSFTIGRRIKAARDAKGMTQNELSKAADISRSTIANFERGFLEIRGYQAVKIAIVLKTKVGWILTGRMDV